ncbi:hypothetical protein JCGZ_08888 [Jatropha curcas]|uniref:Uncharacterized protein n=1 Tax=Jatropha curcas TaxID=180498 RepID=A0A067KWJ6_JATCU|nr:hypothetical protein JCGZ_08888 [Jatropha curcas]
MALARWAIQISVVVLGLLAMAQQSMPLSLRNPMHEIKQKPIGMQTSPVGFVSLTSAAECLLNKSGVFTFTSTQNIAGKIFRIWKINGTDVVYAGAGELMGDNLLGRIFYWASSWFTGQQKSNTGFWLPVDPDWLGMASQIQGLKLETHVNETVYVPYQPVVQFGLKAGTGDLFIVNEAYGDFLHKTFNISTIDTSDSAIALPEWAPLGNINAIKATAAFLGLLNPDDSVTNE